MFLTLLGIAFIECPQSGQCQEMIDPVDGRRLLGNHPGQTARGNYLHLRAMLRLDAANNLIDLSNIAEDDASLHSLNRIAADDLTWRNQLDAWQLCRSLEQGICTGADARRN